MTASAPERLRCMVLATWYPSEADPVDGVFVREGAHAIARRSEVAVLRAAPDGGRLPGLRSDARYVHEAVAARWAQTYHDVLAAPRPA
jgi:hypothetical protein